MVDVVSICQDLVRMRSMNPPGDEQPVAEYCCRLLQDEGFETRLLPHAIGRASALARLPGKGAAPGLLICSHIDTVPVGTGQWKSDPLSGALINGAVWGRGASDMKGGLSAALAAACQVARSGVDLQGDLWLAMTAGEEVDFLGARAVAELAGEILPLQAILLPEPSDNQLFIAQKGALWVEVCLTGKTAHGSMPEHGINAVLLALEVINRLRALPISYQPHPLLGGFTFAPTTIHGGVKTNVIPDECRVTIDMRTVPGQANDAILAQVRQVVEEVVSSCPGAHGEVIVRNNAASVMTPADHPAVERFQLAARRALGSPAPIGGVNYFTDSAVLTQAWEVPMLICGPGRPELAHQPDEFVEVQRLIDCAKLFEQVILEFVRMKQQM